MNNNINTCTCCCQSICPDTSISGNRSKYIKVYGTLLNHTLDVNKSNGNTSDNDYHNDAIALAYQLYDNRFFSSDTIENYQDMINKRLTAISYANNVTTIENRDHSKGNPYMLIVKGNTNIGGDLYVDGSIYYKKPDNTYEQLDLGDILNRLANLEAHMLWELGNDGKVHTIGDKAAAAHGFYDTDPSMQ